VDRDFHRPFADAETGRHFGLARAGGVSGECEVRKTCAECQYSIAALFHMHGDAAREAQCVDFRAAADKAAQPRSTTRAEMETIRVKMDRSPIGSGCVQRMENSGVERCGKVSYHARRLNAA
jgi:proline racemase